MERYDKSDFLLVEFTWVDKGLLFICSTWRYIRMIHLSAMCVKRVYSAPFFEVLSNKRCRISLFVLPVLRNVVSPLRLLLGSVDLNQHQPCPICRQPLIGSSSLHGPLTLQINLEHCLELSSHNFLMHLSRHPPKCSIPKEVGGE